MKTSLSNYRFALPLSEAKFSESFPEIPDTSANLNVLEASERATLHQFSLTANFHHRNGLFAQWESTLLHQQNSGFTPALAAEDAWHHNILAGYRFPRRQAEVRVGLLNIFDTDYRLNPLNGHGELPRRRTVTLSLRVNF